MKRGILANLDELADLAARCSVKPYDRISDLLRKRCAMILESRPVTEADWRHQYQRGISGAALTAARTTQGRVWDMAICHHIDTNAAYRNRAIEGLCNLAGWSEWLATANRREMPADLCTAECCVTMAIGLDWLIDYMTDAQRQKCVSALIEKGVKPYLQAVEQRSWWYECYHNWNAVINSSMIIAALALEDECELAAKTHQLATAGLKHFFDALGSEGGWDEGTAYWGYAMRYLLLAARAQLRMTGDKSILHQRGMSETCDFGMYFTPMGHSMSFGDSPAVPLYGALYAGCDMLNSRTLCWLLDRWAYHRDIDTTGWSDAGLGVLLRPTSMEYLPAIDPPPLKVYREIGWAAVADHWCEPQMYAAVKTGDLSAHHSHLDMNSIQIQFKGEALLSNTVNAPATHKFHYSPISDSAYETATQAHNTITIGERNHRIDARGEIENSQIGDDYRWLCARAGDALGENVHFHRHVLMIMPPGALDATHLLILDQLDSVRAEPARLMWHSYADVLCRDSKGIISGRRGSLHYHLAANTSFDVSLVSRKIGRNSESAIQVDLPAAASIIVASVFSRQQCQKLAIDAQKNSLSVAIDDLTAEFRRTANKWEFSQLQR